MIKTVITQLYIAFCLICFFACEKQKEEFPDIRIAVSYTHLTLPTIYSV